MPREYPQNNHTSFGFDAEFPFLKDVLKRRIALLMPLHPN
jgi:hypothetical protein